MSLTVNVPSIKCEGCAEMIEKEIKVHDADANVKVDLKTKMVTVDSNMSDSSVKQAITIAGHEVAE
jgi:copper chaperone